MQIRGQVIFPITMAGRAGLSPYRLMLCKADEPLICRSLIAYPNESLVALG